MPAKTAFILLSVFLILSSFAKGQENYYSKTYTTDNGLPHNHIRSLAQDSTGFLWIATWDGLSRYNGYEFRNYYHNPADSTSLGYFIAENLRIDFMNNLWITGFSAISKYNPATDNFTQFKFKNIGGATLDRQGRYWLSTEDELHYWNYETNVMQPVRILANHKQYQYKNVNPWMIFFDNNNRLITSELNADGIWYFYYADSINGNTVEINFLGYFDSVKNAPKAQNFYPEIYFVNTIQNEYYISGNQGILKLNKTSEEFEPYKLPEAEAKISNELFNAYQRQKLYISSDADNQFVETAITDKQKTIWQGILSPNSMQTGLTRSIKVNTRFKHYFTGLNPENELNGFFPVIKDSFGIIWGGTANRNMFFRRQPNGIETSMKPVDDAAWNLASQRPRSFLEDENGIWIGYFERMLLYYSFEKQKFEIIALKQTGYEDESLPHSFVHLKKTDDEILIVGFKQIFKYNPKKKEFTRLRTFGLNEPVNMYSVVQDKDSSWWIGGNFSTLYHFAFDFNESEIYNLASHYFNIEDIIIGENNDLWLSLLGGGLAHFDKTSGKTIKVYTTADGLSNNTCYGMLKDKNRNLWISTNKGISKFNPKTEQFRTFGKMEGLEIEEFNSDNTFLAPDGEMFFAGMGGVVSFYPDSIEESIQNQEIQPLVFTDFKVSGINRYFSKAVYECDTVRLQKGDDNFQLSFACLDFRNAEKIKYRYRLLPHKKEFTPVDYRHRTINYSGLSPGTYWLEVEATNENGEWSSKKSLLIKIPKFYYQTLGFRLLIFGLFIGFFAYFIYSYNRRLRIKARQKQDELKLESLRGQMNPHFIFNSLNSINYFIAQNDRLSANRYIADFSRLVRSFLGNLSSEFIPFSKELEMLKDYLQLEHLRFGDKFDYELEIDPGIQADEIFVFPGMVQPFVENAIWHGVRGIEGRKGFVRISFSVGADCLQATIEDDGTGRKLAEIRKSNLPGKVSKGIGIVLERLNIANHLYKKTFRLNITDLFPDREETGTRVVIDIPVKEANGNYKRKR